MYTLIYSKRLVQRCLVALLVGFMTLFGWSWLPVDPVLAESMITRETAGYQQLSLEISALQAKGSSLSSSQLHRLSDLQALEAAIVDSNDRASISNATQHNLGIFARSKKESADQPASFYVLGPDHESDDDFEVVALYLPPQVSLEWQDSSTASAASSRLVRVLSGEDLEVSEQSADANSDVVVYRLSLPAFSVDTRNSDVAELPGFTQQQLDAQSETAPVD
jgi:hypothetical protein